MDPLSITTGAVGLMTAAGKLIVSLYDLRSAMKDAAHDANAAATELANITLVVQGLQVYVSGRVKASPQRLQLITVEHITATLAGCIMTSSELDAVLKSLHVGSALRTWDRAKWYLRRDEVTKLTTRLQQHKNTFTMMLNILQCSSLGEAENNMERLCDSVNDLLRRHEQLSLRLRDMEDVRIRRVSTVASTIQGAERSGDRRPSMASRRSSIDSKAGLLGFDVTADRHVGNVRPSAFEEQLHRSRVYRHATGNRDTSPMSDARSTLALSIGSSLTLGDVSKISVYAIPIYSRDLSNASCYEFSTTEQFDETLYNASDENDEFEETPNYDSSPRRMVKVRSWLKSRSRRSSVSSLNSEPAPSAVVFGEPLERSIRYANVAVSLSDDEGLGRVYGYVPLVVAKCGVFLKKKGTEVDNIFEVGGTPKRVGELQDAFDSAPRYGKGIDWEKGRYTVHDAASALLRYFYRLPEPLIPLDFYNRFRIGPSNEELDLTPGNTATVTYYQGIVKDLPALNRHLLLYFVDILAVFASRAAINRMTSRKLADVFQAGVLSHPDHLLQEAERRLSRDILTFLIEHQDIFLIGRPGTSMDDSESTETQTPDQERRPSTPS